MALAFAARADVQSARGEMVGVKEHLEKVEHFGEVGIPLHPVAGGLGGDEEGLCGASACLLVDGLHDEAQLAVDSLNLTEGDGLVW